MGILKNLLKKQQNAKKYNFDVVITSSTNEQKKYTITDDEPPFELSDKQKIVLFLDWCGKANPPLKMNSEYPRWHTYDLHVSPNNFHKKLIEEGFLKPCEPNIALNKLNVEALKNILTTNNIEAKGKKADLINVIISSVDIHSLNLTVHYEPSQKGIELLDKPESKELLIAFGNRYDITLQEFYCIKNKCAPNTRPYDIIWKALNEKHLLYSKNENYALARNVCVNQAYLLEDEKRYLPALEHYIRTVYYDLSGCDYQDNIIEKDEALIAPALINDIQNLSEHYTDEIIERCKRVYLPHHHYSMDEFEKIIKSIISKTDFYKQFLVPEYDTIELEI